MFLLKWIYFIIYLFFLSVNLKTRAPQDCGLPRLIAAEEGWHFAACRCGKPAICHPAWQRLRMARGAGGARRRRTRRAPGPGSASVIPVWHFHRAGDHLSTGRLSGNRIRRSSVSSSLINHRDFLPVVRIPYQTH